MKKYLSTMSIYAFGRNRCIMMSSM